MAEAVSAPFQIAGNIAIAGSDRKVHLKNFQTGKEVALSQDQFKKQLKKNADKIAEGESVNFKKPKVFAKVLAGLAAAGAITAGAVYRKNIGNFVKGLKDGKAGELAKTVKTKAGTAVDTVKEKAGKWYNKAADRAVDKWHKVVDYFKGLFGKKSDSKAGELFSKAGESVKKGRDAVKKSVKNVSERVKSLFGADKKVNNGLFCESILPETRKLKNEILADYANNATLRPSGTTERQWRSDLAKKYGAVNVH